MIYIEFKHKRPIGPKKVQYAKILAFIIRELTSLRKTIDLENPKINLDYKIIFKEGPNE